MFIPIIVNEAKDTEEYENTAILVDKINSFLSLDIDSQANNIALEAQNSAQEFNDLAKEFINEDSLDALKQEIQSSKGVSKQINTLNDNLEQFITIDNIEDVTVDCADDEVIVAGSCAKKIICQVNQFVNIFNNICEDSDTSMESPTQPTSDTTQNDTTNTTNTTNSTDSTDSADNTTTDTIPSGNTNIAYINSCGTGMKIIDITNPANMELKESYSIKL